MAQTLGELGALIRQVRSRRGISQIELARILDIAPPVLCVMEGYGKGHPPYRPGDRYWWAVCEYLGIPDAEIPSSLARPPITIQQVTGLLNEAQSALKVAVPDTLAYARLEGQVEVLTRLLNGPAQHRGAA